MASTVVVRRMGTEHKEVLETLSPILLPFLVLASLLFQALLSHADASVNENTLYGSEF